MDSESKAFLSKHAAFFIILGKRAFLYQSETDIISNLSIICIVSALIFGLFLVIVLCHFILHAHDSAVKQRSAE